MTTENLTSETPVDRAMDALHEVIQEHPEELAGELDLRRLAQAALAESATAYVAPDRPIEVDLGIADEQGLSPHQTISLPRDMATPEVLGTALGNAVVAALASYYCGADAAELGDAVQAVRSALG